MTANSFTTPIEIDVPDVGLIKFTNAIELESWASAERQFWTELNSKISQFNPFGRDYFINSSLSLAADVHDTCRSYIQASTTEAQRVSLLQHLRSRMNEYSGRRVLASMSPNAELARRLAETNPNASWVALAFCIAPSENIVSQNVKIIELLRGYLVYSQNGIDTQKSLDQIFSNHSELRGYWQKQFGSQLVELRDFQNRVTRRTRRWGELAQHNVKLYSRMRSDHETQMAEMRKAFSTDMKLRAAEKMWAKKRKINRERARWAFKKFIGTAIIGLALVTLVFVQLHERIGLPQTLSVAHGLIYGLPVLVYVWFLRFLGNDYRANQRMADDAEEREAMILTFKALEYSQKATDNERALILAALFRPHSMSTEESVPMPLFEAILSKVK